MIDFPERWPTLLQGLLNVINTKTSAEYQVHGALRVLAGKLGGLVLVMSGLTNLC